MESRGEKGVEVDRRDGDTAGGEDGDGQREGEEMEHLDIWIFRVSETAPSLEFSGI